MFLRGRTGCCTNSLKRAASVHRWLWSAYSCSGSREDDCLWVGSVINIVEWMGVAIRARCSFLHLPLGVSRKWTSIGVLKASMLICHCYTDTVDLIEKVKEILLKTVPYSIFQINHLNWETGSGRSVLLRMLIWRD